MSVSNPPKLDDLLKDLQHMARVAYSASRKYRLDAKSSIAQAIEEIITGGEKPMNVMVEMEHAAQLARLKKFLK